MHNLLHQELLNKIHSEETLLSIPNNFLRLLEIIKAKKNESVKFVKLIHQDTNKLFIL